MAISISGNGRTTYGPRITRDGLVLYLDAANTKSYPGSGTTLSDLSGNSYNGTLINGPTFDSANSGSFLFDGVDDYIALSSPSNRWSWTPSGAGLNTMTIDLWVRTTDVFGYVLSKPWNGNGEYNYLIYPDPSFPYHGIWYLTAGGVGYSQTFSSMSTGSWENVTCIVTATQAATYRNGSISYNFANHGLTANSPTFGNNSVNLSLMTFYPYGSTFSIPSHAINGNLALIRIYNRVLTAAEISQNYRANRVRFGRTS